jgi:DNA-binding NarL/FixJ family response regulator
MLLDQEPGMIVSGMADRIKGIIAQLEGAQPDVLLLDWALMTQPVEDFFRDLRNLECQPAVIVLSADPQIKDTVLAAGAIFFICSDSPPDALLPKLNDIRQAKINKPEIQ